MLSGWIYKLYLENALIIDYGIEGKTVKIDNLTYVEYPEVIWEPIDISNKEKIGYSKSFWVYKFKRDVNEIFIGISNRRGESFTTYLYKAGFQMPEVSPNGVSLVGFCFAGNEGTYNEGIYDAQTRDKETIAQLFECMKNEQIVDFTEYYQKGEQKFVGWLILRNDDLDGIHIMMGIIAMGDKYWVNTSGHYYYAEIPKELLQKIAGKEMPNAEDYIS